MAIQRFGSFLDDAYMPQSFSSMLDRFFNDSVNNRSKVADFTPHVDTCETETGYEIDLTLPGLKKEEINIEFQEGRLTISGERKFRNENKDKRYHQIESQYGSFSRSFVLPQNVDPAAINAEFQDGILRVNVPKDKQKVMKHHIQIKDGSQNQVGQGQNQNAEQNQHWEESQSVNAKTNDTTKKNKEKANAA